MFYYYYKDYKLQISSRCFAVRRPRYVLQDTSTSRYNIMFCDPFDRSSPISIRKRIFNIFKNQIIIPPPHKHTCFNFKHQIFFKIHLLFVRNNRSDLIVFRGDWTPETSFCVHLCIKRTPSLGHLVGRALEMYFGPSHSAPTVLDCG